MSAEVRGPASFTVKKYPKSARMTQNHVSQLDAGTHSELAPSSGGAERRVDACFRSRIIIHHHTIEIKASHCDSRPLVAPRMFFGACEHQHGLRADQRGADYAEHFQMCRSRNTPQTAIWTGSGTGSVQIQLQFGSEPEISANCNSICAEVGQNRVQMSDVRLSEGASSN